MGEFSRGIVWVWGLAGAEAKAGRHEEIQPTHLMLGLCKACDVPLHRLAQDEVPQAGELVTGLEEEIGRVREIFEAVGLDVTGYRRALRGEMGVGGAPPPEDVIHRSPASRRLFGRAADLASDRAEAPRVIHLLAALLELQDKPWMTLLARFGADPTELMETVQDAMGSVKSPQQKPAVASPMRAKESPTGEPAPDLPTLEKFGRDLTKLAADGKLDPVIGRRAEMKRLGQALMQKKKNSVVLVGDAGVGKTCIVEGLAQIVAGPEPPPALRGRRIFEVSMAALVAGAKHRGDFEERLQNLIEEAGSSKDVIVFIDEMHMMVGAGGEGGMDASNILKPVLARGQIQCIGATTTAEYRKYIEKDAALQRRLQVVWVNEPTRREAVEILQGLRPNLEEHHGLEVTEEAIEAAVEMSMRYLPDFRLPDKAIDLIDQACARARLLTLSLGGGSPDAEPIGREQIARVVANRCRIPVERLTMEESERLLHMEDALRERVMGQDEAVKAVCRAVRVARSGLKDPRKPLGVFLFVGATGTGKTELAKALAEFLFADESKLIAFDMSEYARKHNVARLIGAPPGYVGYDEEGQLTGQVRTNPCSVVLFDEVEKAHPEVFDIFLQIFDEGRLTDSKGRRASFSETLIIMTSNVGSQAEPEQRIGLHLGARGAQTAQRSGREGYRSEIVQAVREALRPELLNRIGEVVFFYPLGRETVRQIADKIMDRVRERLAARQIDVRLADDACDLLMEAGFSPTYGAREMERAVERLIVQPLGDALLEGRFEDGATVIARRRDDAVVFDTADFGGL